MLASSFASASLAFAFLCYGAGPTCVSAGSAAAGNASLKPYWQRPGCYQVGHTRTISIPGCVKFNLSTNACRGYCMSFSIPAAEDIGPGPAGRLDEPADGQRAGPGRLAPSTSSQQQLLALLGRQSQFVEPDPEQAHLMDALMTERRAKKAASRGSPSPDDLALLGHSGELSTFLHLAGQTRSPLTGAVGDTSDKRDVISVGQCCNMMETEDVTVNLRCGLNETRRLIFKSAKTCECFFCKHV